MAQNTKYHTMCMEGWTSQYTSPSDKHASPEHEPCCMRHSQHHAVHKPRRVSPKSFQKPHQRKQGDHISCRGSPGIPLVLFLLSRSHVTHCFDWQNFQRWAQGLLKPSSFFRARLSVSVCYCFPLALFTLSQYVSHGPSSDTPPYHSHSPFFSTSF